MMKSFSLAVAAFCILAAPAFAADTPTATKPAAPADAKAAKTDKKPKPEDKLICTRETSTDSFLSKRVCRTQAQIDADRRAAQQMEDDRQSLSNRLDVQGGTGSR